MGLTYGLAKSTQEAQEGIRVPDRRLMVRRDMSGRPLNRDQDMPGIEQLVIPAATGESPADRDFLNKQWGSPSRARGWYRRRESGGS